MINLPTYLTFIFIAGTIGIVGAFILSFKSATWPTGRILIPLLSILLCASGFFEYIASFETNLVLKNLWIRSTLVLQFLIGISLLELTVCFLGKDGIPSPLKIRSRPIRLRLLWRLAAIIAIEAAVITPWFVYSSDGTTVSVNINRIGELLFAALFCFHLIILYIVEKIFRTATTMQKRMFMLYLASTGIIALGTMVGVVRILFFTRISFTVLQFHTTLSGIFFPGILIGLARYRLWQEQIAIGRGIVYTSITVIFFGLFLIALGVLASAVRFLGIRFDEFEGFVFLFTLLFLGIFLIFSPHMRANITSLSRKYIYKSKYDYRDQLLRLHAAHETTGNVSRTIRAFIDNLRYTIVVKNAFVFVRSPSENLLICMDYTADSRVKATLRANSMLVDLLEENVFPYIDINFPDNDTVRNAIEAERTFVDNFSVSHMFAIKHDTLLVGILVIEAGKRVFDSEDFMLISMFCESIGTAIFRDRIESDRIEQKQFESFSHMASFIVHDIKNQVATLSLVTKNARDNISDPEFHPVLLRSLENCSTNLSTLIEKLKSPPKKENLAKDNVDCRAIVKTVVDHTLSALPEKIAVTTSLSEVPVIEADPVALSYILKNLIINAIEALGSKGGEIHCVTAPLATMNNDDTGHFGMTVPDNQNHSLYIAIEDNGPGMSREFIEQKLFKPFNTTKDKGIGIGLYQCKTLIESMGGRLLCYSETGKGTRFRIVL